MKVAIVGATGLVGKVMREVLEEREFPVTELIPVASQKSVGQKVTFRDEEWTVVSIEEALQRNPDIALFSAGSDVSNNWALSFTEQGTFVVDNSSAWRMKEDIPLIVPEINGQILQENDRLIANPNCSTTQLVMALYPLQQEFGIEQIIVSTYQSVTGSGKKAVDQMNQEREGKEPDRDYPHPIDLNCLPHCDDFQSNDYTREEMKMVHETRKIFQDNEIAVSPTAVRIPVMGGHGESVTLSLKQSTEVGTIKKLMDDFPGVEVCDDPSQNLYPMPLSAQGKDEVFVGRIRKDLASPNTFNLWIVADNLRKGAATNTIQIAEYIVANQWVQVPSQTSE